MVRIDVTNISTGMITIAAVDTAENMGYAYPKLLRVRDARPPEAPTQVRGLPSLDGTIAILWEMSDTLDMHHYDVFWANSPTMSLRSSIAVMSSRGPILTRWRWTSTSGTSTTMCVRSITPPIIRCAFRHHRRPPSQYGASLATPPRLRMG